MTFCPVKIKDNETCNRQKNKRQPKQDAFLTVAVIPVTEEPLTIWGLYMEMLTCLYTGTEVRVIILFVKYFCHLMKYSHMANIVVHFIE